MARLLRGFLRDIFHRICDGNRHRAHVYVGLDIGVQLFLGAGCFNVWYTASNQRC